MNNICDSSIKLISPETSYKTHLCSPHFTYNELDFLVNQYQNSSRKRHRICFHQNTSVALHDIVIIYDKDTYIPPNKHIGKPETISVLQGSLQVFIFNDFGVCINIFELSALGDSDTKPFLLRMPPNTWHGLRCISDEPCIVKETITGPYSKDSLSWAPFAPSETENSLSSVGFAYYEKLARDNSEVFQNNLESDFIKLNDNVLLSSNQFPIVNRVILNALRLLASDSPLRRSRLCLHPNSSDLLQEMIIHLAPGCDIDISYHLNKDESLVVLEGSGKYDFYMNTKDVVASIGLAPFSKLNSSQFDACFARINRFIAHKIYPSADQGITVYEATSGPFVKSDTQYRIDSIV